MELEARQTKSRAQEQDVVAQVLTAMEGENVLRLSADDGFCLPPGCLTFKIQLLQELSISCVCTVILSRYYTVCKENTMDFWSGEKKHSQKNTFSVGLKRF